jgi:hypothetical protein
MVKACKRFYTQWNQNFCKFTILRHIQNVKVGNMQLNMISNAILRRIWHMKIFESEGNNFMCL